MQRGIEGSMVDEPKRGSAKYKGIDDSVSDKSLVSRYKKGEVPK
jgi:hypothetical protein